MKRFLQNKYYLTNLFVSFVLLASFLFYGYSSGITQKTRKNGQGCNCHGSSPSTAVNVTISGPNSLTPGSKGIYRVSISGGPLVRAGTNIAASSGELSIVQGSGLQKIGDELTHTSPKAPSGGVVTFDFEFTAPNSTGQVTLYAIGNSVNFNGSTSGDQWNFANDFIINVGTTSVENEKFPVKEFELYQNYPNPFNPSTKISYKLNKDGFTKLTIINLFGEEVVKLVDEFQREGLYEIDFDADRLNFSSGTYFYKLESNGLSDIRKLVYLK
ncbi:MAG: choice-of-anchor V domain-containing protein [Ignavibacteria bacterium]